MYTLTYPWLLLLAFLPAIIRFVMPEHKQVQRAIRVPGFSKIQSVLGLQAREGVTVKKQGKVWMLFHYLLWLLLVVALARPQLIEPPVERVLPSRDLMLLVDLSGSMETRDFVGKSGEEINRLEAVKGVLADFLKGRQGDRVGLIVFGNSAFVQVPFTQDLEACQQLLSELQVRMAGPKTAFGDAIGLGITLFENSEIEDRLMIALTDGNDTGSRVPPAQAAKIAADNNITIHVIGIGDPQAVGEEKLDEATLRAVGESSGGKYFHADDGLQLSEVYEEIDKLETREVQKEVYYPKTDLYHVFLSLFFVVTVLYHLSLVVRGTRAGGSDG